MVFLFVMTAVLLAACVAAVWPWSEPAPGTEDGREQPAAAGEARPESLEGVLVAQLRAGEITRRQYLRAMGSLAARDDVRHPLAPPPDTRWPPTEA
ncbi:hypothetical protein EV385_6569 [Krasilnikovia cinnamomea]|uniref:Uncharacterized protein n=1 Tax=Krasilnikovia cinnamomea TaxID=349313 RepID=A0A4Q7ZTP3_9ACTN|nr:hypothetical protein [Krasilnikovia cinnamomea]RZU54618.1 hypothetical protein EV385_6569 [Krasilnikovia cinnamomea]